MPQILRKQVLATSPGAPVFPLARDSRRGRRSTREMSAAPDLAPPLSATCDDVDLGLEVVGFIECMQLSSKHAAPSSGESRGVVDGGFARRKRVCDCPDPRGLASALVAWRSSRDDDRDRPSHATGQSEPDPPCRGVFEWPEAIVLLCEINHEDQVASKALTSIFHLAGEPDDTQFTLSAARMMRNVQVPLSDSLRHHYWAGRDAAGRVG
jgi:hypothetical protein